MSMFSLDYVCVCVISKVYIRIHGTKGKLPKQQLTKKSASIKNKKKAHFKFNRGTTHVFKFEGKDIGDITSISIEVNIHCLVATFI